MAADVVGARQVDVGFVEQRHVGTLDGSQCARGLRQLVARVAGAVVAQQDVAPHLTRLAVGAAAVDAAADVHIEVSRGAIGSVVARAVDVDVARAGDVELVPAFAEVGHADRTAKHAATDVELVLINIGARTISVDVRKGFIDGILANQDGHRAVDVAAFARAIHVAQHRATLHVDERGPMLVRIGKGRIAVVGEEAATVQVAFNGSPPHVDPTRSIVLTLVGNLAASAKHAAFDHTVGNVDYLSHSHHALASAAIHVVPNGGLVGGSVVIARSLDVDGGVAIHLAGGGRNVSFAVGAESASATIHVAVEEVVVFAIGVGILCIANGAALHVNQSVFSHMAVLAATKHRAVHLGHAVDDDMRVLDVCQVHVFAAHTSVARSEHVAVVLVFVDSAYRATQNPDRGQAGFVCFALCGFRFIGVAHRGHVAAAIHVTDDAAALDGHVSVAIHLASGSTEVTLIILVEAATAAIHVAFQHVEMGADHARTSDEDMGVAELLDFL